MTMICLYSFQRPHICLFPSHDLLEWPYVCLFPLNDLLEWPYICLFHLKDLLERLCIYICMFPLNVFFNGHIPGICLFNGQASICSVAMFYLCVPIGPICLYKFSSNFYLNGHVSARFLVFYLNLTIRTFLFMYLLLLKVSLYRPPRVVSFLSVWYSFSHLDQNVIISCQCTLKVLKKIIIMIKLLVYMGYF